MRRCSRVLIRAARGRVVEADLRALGVTNLPPFPVAYHGVPPGPELFFNEQPHDPRPVAERGLGDDRPDRGVRLSSSRR